MKVLLNRSLQSGYNCLCVGMVMMLGFTCAARGYAAQASERPSESVLTRQLHQALTLVEHGDGQQALSMTNKLLKQHPTFVPALKLQGMLLEEAGRSEEAAQSYERGLKLAPADSDLLFKVGVNRLLSGRNEEAITFFLHHLRLEQKDGDALYYLAQAYHLTGHNDLALKAIQACLLAQPNNPPVWQKYGELLCSSGDSEAGLHWLLKAQQAKPSLDRIDYDLAIASLNTMDLQNAALYAEKAASLHQNDAGALALLASAEEKLSQWQEAQSAYRRILALKQDEPDALLGLGHCQLELRQPQAAIDTLNRLLQADPGKVLAHYYLARAYAGLGNTAEAQHQGDLHHKMMEQASFAAPALGTEEDKAVWARARQLLIEHREEAAVKLFKENAKGVSASPGHPYFLVGTLDFYLGNAADGERALHHALQIDPAVRGAHTYLGIYDLQQGKLDAAEQEFSAELAHDPNYQTALAELGLVRFKQQRWAEAADKLAKSHTRTPALLLTLCDAYFHLGNIKDANLTAEIVAAYARDDQETMDRLVELLNSHGQGELARRLSGLHRP